MSSGPGELLILAPGLERFGEQDEALKNLLVGIEATERQLLAAFDRGGIKKMEALGEPFDPNRHEALMHQPSPHPDGTVTQTLQKGYALQDRILRAAMVTVSTGAPN